MYVFKTVELPLPSQEQPVKPKHDPTGAIIVSSLLVFWLATFAVVGKSIPDWAVWILLIIYGIMGLLIGYYAYNRFYAHRLLKYERDRVKQSFLTQAPLQGWKYSETLLEHYIRNGLNNDTSIMFDKTGKEWTIVDIHKTPEMLTLFLRAAQ